MSEEDKKLEEIAHIKRSEILNLKSLKELCMLCILNNVRQFALQKENPLQRLSPALHRDYMRFLENQGTANNQFDDEDHAKVVSLLDLLLNEATTEFDFILLSERAYHLFERDLEIWQLLIQKCPNLVRITDKRNFIFSEAFGYEDLRLSNVMPFLFSFPALLHLDLYHFLCEEDTLSQLVEAFPGLLTLSVNFEHLSYNGLSSLFKLQKLEVLKINFRYPLDITMQQVMEFSQSMAMDECIKHMPALRVACTDNSSDNMRYGFHNFRTGVENRVLPLECLKVKKKFNGWTAATVPNVTTLWLQGPLENVSEFLGLQNLCTLKLCEVYPADTMKILNECRGRLKELTIFTLSPNEWFTYDPHKIFFLCPKLHKIDWNAEVNAGRPDLYPVSAENFEQMRQFEFYSPLVRFPSSMITHVLKAKNLNYFGIINLRLSLEDLKEITSCLKSGTILQNLTEFRLTYGEDVVCHELINFLKLLPVYAPRLKMLSCYSGTREFLFELRNSNIGNLNIPGFEFEMNNDFDDLLEG